ncbi:MAG: hypothetical protein H6832_00125 [Planctomycetes bacterium]|nr:hypothetical protein [Planctomycetota bacterium]MCB9916788.1 hypothetical protein [Planctomycetota bacterium]
MNPLYGILAAVMASMVVLGDRDAFREGVVLLRAGKASEAFATLQRAEKSYGDEIPAELLADLALAAHATDRLDDAAAYAERAAAMDARFDLLRDTVVGAVRLKQAQEAMAAQPQPDLGHASTSALRAITAFTRALSAQPESDKARRNLERALLLKQEIEDQQQRKDDETKKDEKKKDDEKKDDKEQNKKSDEQKQDEQKQDEKKQDEKKQNEKSDEKKQDEQKQDEQKPDEKPDEQSKSQPIPDESKQDEQKPQDPQKADEQAPNDEKPEGSKQQEPKEEDAKAQPSESKQEPTKGGEPQETTEQHGELTPTEVRLLQRQLEKLMEEQRKLRKAQAERSQPGKKGW